MGRRGRKADVYAEIAEPTKAREELERRWRDRLTREHRLAAMVSAEGAHHEPFHRWLHYRQGFSPELVRLFLSENPDIAERSEARPVLDPFAGSGTVVVECARRNVHALGVEVLSSLVFLANVRTEQAIPRPPEWGDSESWASIAGRLREPLHRAALMLAVGRQYTTSGKPNKGAKPLPLLLNEVFSMMRDDLRSPLPFVNLTTQGDARELSGLGDETIGGILTSPPYISRHDYQEIAAPYETVYRYWHGDDSSAGSAAVSATSPGLESSSQGETEEKVPPFDAADLFEAHAPESAPSSRQIPASSRSRPFYSAEPSLIPAVVEACSALARSGSKKLSRVVAAYFSEMEAVLRECARVLAPQAACWVVVGGARLKGVYIPSDLILAELAEAQGLAVETVLVARDLIHARRKFGSIGHLSPRESILVARKA